VRGKHSPPTTSTTLQQTQFKKVQAIDK
jgi:hypothetical protein